jgi:hypothetical protein
MMTPGPAAKPLDVGSGRTVASFHPSTAGWLSLGAPHPEHGFVELSAMPPFDERRRGDPGATREHRRSMTDATTGWLGVEVDGAPVSLTPRFGPADAARWWAGGVAVEAWAPDGGTIIHQRWTFTTSRRVRIAVRGALDRPALAEITELDPPQPTDASSSWHAAGDRAVLEGTAGRVTVRAPVRWRVGAGEVVGTTESSAFVISVEMGHEDTNAPRLAVRGDMPGPGDRLTARALTYVRGCTALWTGPGERVILTDHRILPLSWTRDAYWQALALLAADGPGDRERVADHLRWLFRRCERPDGRWVRSHHANGRRKDLAIQADQQVYPLIELADHWRLTGALPDGVAWADEIDRVWGTVRADLDAGGGLVASAENAADDPAQAPFIAASQIVIWYAAARLAELAAAARIRPSSGSLQNDAAAIRHAFDRAFGTGGPWPYAVDGSLTRIAYHDANDLPVALAPLWGFCAPDDAGWRATMSFGWSDRNPAWVDGAGGGLGSAHTPGPWTLGYVQAWAAAAALGDARGMATAAARLDGVAFPDGMLPEAHATDGEERIRHWFAWPGAAWAALQLLERRGALLTALQARDPR